MNVLSALPASLSSALGIVFVLLGIAAVWLIFDSSRRIHSSIARQKIIGAHRVVGYLFIGLFCWMVSLMILRTGATGDELPVRGTLHILIALVLVPLLLVKILVARYYKSFMAVLVPLGLTIFTLAFVLVGSSAGPYLLRSSTVKRLSMQDTKGASEIDLAAAEQLMLKRCTRCHTLERVMGARKDAGAWLTTINRMRALPGSGISDRDAKTVLSCLIAENSIDSSSAHGALSVGRALVDTHCARCHNLDRVYQSTRSAEDWRTTVGQMVAYTRGMDGFFKPGEDERIIQFLSATQTPMLRYIDDLCLDTKTTLFYSVRTQRDIIFDRELKDLQGRLPNFQLIIVPTQPDRGWSGPTGRLSQEMVIEHLDNSDRQMFFLCGPDPFMHHVDSMLQRLGVGPQAVYAAKSSGARKRLPRP